MGMVSVTWIGGLPAAAMLVSSTVGAGSYCS